MGQEQTWYWTSDARERPTAEIEIAECCSRKTKDNTWGMLLPRYKNKKANLR
jgi:hypothetical protein